MAFDYYTKFIIGKHCDIYPPSRKSHIAPYDPAILVPPREDTGPEHEIK